MLYFSAVFFLIALIAGNFGLSAIAVGAAALSKSLLFFFIVVFFVSLIMGAAKDRGRE